MDWILYAPQYHALILILVLIAIWLLIRIDRRTKQSKGAAMPQDLPEVEVTGTVCWPLFYLGSLLHVLGGKMHLYGAELIKKSVKVTHAG